MKPIAFSVRGLVAVALWGASFVATRVALEAFHPVGLVASRLGVGALLLALFARWTGGRVLPERGDRAACVLLGLLLATHLVIQAEGLRYTTAVNAGWIVGVQPVAIALGAQLLLGQRLAGIGWSGVAVATVGLLLVTARTPPDFAHARFGDLLELSTVLTWTGFSLIAARPLRRSGALRVNALAMGVAAAAAVGVGLCLPGAPGSVLVPGPLDAHVLGAWAFLAVLCSAVAMWLWLGALAVDGAARTAAMLYLEPFFTLGVSVWLLGEPVLPIAFLGGTLVLCGVWLVGRGTPRA